MRRFLIGAGVVVAGVLATGAPSFAAEREAAAGGCSSYALLGTDTTICDLFPGNKDRDCADIGKPVKIFAGDPWRLDRDKNGVGCDTSDLKPVAGGAAKPGGGQKALPKTGPGLPVYLGGGVALLGVGTALVVARRRKVSFVA